MENELTVEALTEWLDRWLLPTEEPEELSKQLMWAANCAIEVDLGPGKIIATTSGKAFKDASGKILFLSDGGLFADRSGWCTPYVRRWMPKLAHVADAEE